MTSGNKWGKWIIMVVLWVVTGLTVTFVRPEWIKDVLIEGFYLPLLLILGLAVFWTSYLVTKRARSGLVVSAAVLLILVLGLLRYLNPITAIITLALAAVLTRM